MSSPASSTTSCWCARRDSDSFNRLHAEQLLYLPGVRQIRSFMVLKQVLSTTQIPLA